MFLREADISFRSQKENRHKGHLFEKPHASFPTPPPPPPPPNEFQKRRPQRPWQRRRRANSESSRRPRRGEQPDTFRVSGFFGASFLPPGLEDGGVLRSCQNVGFGQWQPQPRRTGFVTSGSYALFESFNQAARSVSEMCCQMIGRILRSFPCSRRCPETGPEIGLGGEKEFIAAMVKPIR